MNFPILYQYYKSILENQCGLSPDGQQTECVSLRECEYLNDNTSIMRNFPTHRIYIEMLINSNCGYDIIGPMVLIIKKYSFCELSVLIF